VCGGFWLSATGENAFFVATDSCVSCEKSKLKFSLHFLMGIPTLGSFEVGKVPHEFSDEKSIVSKFVERFEVL
jgi:hypothetical protein